MAKFLTDADFAEMRTAINDTVETFAQLDVTYKKVNERTVSRFNRDIKENQTFTDYALKGLVVWAKDEDSKMKMDENGKWDLAEGYVLFSIDELETAGLFASNVLLTQPEKDRIEFNGINYEVIGTPSLGQIKDKDAVVRVYFKKNLSNG